MKIVILDKSTLGEDIDLSPIYALGEVEAFETTAPDEIAERLTETDVVVINKIKLKNKYEISFSTSIIRNVSACCSYLS